MTDPGIRLRASSLLVQLVRARAVAKRDQSSIVHELRTRQRLALNEDREWVEDITHLSLNERTARRRRQETEEALAMLGLPVQPETNVPEDSGEEEG